jgi:hypothetical protein
LFRFLDHKRKKDPFPPEGSHLMPVEARIFTKRLAQFFIEKKD